MKLAPERIQVERLDASNEMRIKLGRTTLVFDKFTPVFNGIRRESSAGLV